MTEVVRWPDLETALAVVAAAGLWCRRAGAAKATACSLCCSAGMLPDHRGGGILCVELTGHARNQLGSSGGGARQRKSLKACGGEAFESEGARGGPHRATMLPGARLRRAV